MESGLIERQAMTDNQNTPLEDRLAAAKNHILADRKIWKRLRYARAILLVGGNPTDKQALMVAADIRPYLKEQGVSLEDYRDNQQLITKYIGSLEEIAWSEGSVDENAKVLKEARKNIFGDER